MCAFFHRDGAGNWHPFSDAENALLERAHADGAPSSRGTLAAGGGPVTRQLFEDYYDLQSITVDRDEQFEALVRSSWIALVRQKAAARKKRG